LLKRPNWGTIFGSLSVIEADSQIAVCDFGVSHECIVASVSFGWFGEDRSNLTEQFSVQRLGMAILEETSTTAQLTLANFGKLKNLSVV
jgi:hypothetical protein